ncbi:MAG: hypothetical protein BGO49_24715 [Planctomycetales bacterium 71-10]|nr:MAG: hypothetical protein BGO49_24715 [Planctomycetales bacterium 71-10]
MTADKRTVTTDALETLGSIITESEKRDAIHLAVDNVVAAHTLRPGEDVGFLSDGTVGTCDTPVGIVDPFLKTTVKKGERFWIVVYPRQITSLRHVWTHPAFPEVPEVAGLSAVEAKATPRSQSEQWLRDYAEGIPVDYDELMENAKSYLEHGEYWHEGDRFDGEFIPLEFWNHYEAVTGTSVPESKRGSFFSCAC